MQKDGFNYDLSEDDFSEILDRAKSGDKDSIQKILEIFEDEIKKMAKFVLMPEQDAIQTIKLRFLEIILPYNNFPREKE
ncbi:helix-turn-helix domain-containing protein [Paenibacillus sp. MZ04-78.2]|uniref:helix-turn-helix domain-containing protein n=1 Tax=Paenibacillus sp. MZ04-78.2 TaxID=2962034 RepID=UPI0020B799CC|nr:helix-turn-helix domain-containing protein [Paenibacillus sp. MZ04-78.2]MCP3776323.1 helix-turn-helix domain-containing protein [Paenibacillus sp. MZ04-78.2]